jgi:hypothetical protein
MKKINIILMLFCVLLSGCSEDERLDLADIQVPIESAEAQFTAAGGRHNITVGIEGYTVTSDKSWCKVTAAGKIIDVNVDPNKTVSGRTALLTIRSGEKTNYIPVTQTGVILTLKSYTVPVPPKGGETRAAFKCDFPVSITAGYPSWITVSIDETSKEVIVTAEANPSYYNSRKATVQLYVDDGADGKMAPADMFVEQAKNYLEYEEYLGDYTMLFTSSASATNTTPNRSLDVSLVAAEEGASYYLKGILADESAGNIVVGYNPTSGNLTVLGQIIGKTVPDNWDLWWLPYSYSNTATGSFYISLNATYGLETTNLDISSGKLKFAFRDIGNWSGYTLFGFILRNYNGTTSMGNVNGKNGYAYFYPTFEKK